MPGSRSSWPSGARSRAPGSPHSARVHRRRRAFVR